jgi:hypothetical protein
MDSDSDEKLSSLYEGFMGLTAEEQDAVVETAQSLLEAQKELEALIGDRQPAKTDKTTGNNERTAGCDKTRRLPTGNC